ncbi:MAG: tetratricopeptide repeat protein [Blastocatellia bacterium]|nr:tetratricopeptide repeat protein [Blastocatellia bacterium]
MKQGSIEEIVARLNIWCKRAPKGLARAEFDSEFARSQAVNRLRLLLAETNTPFHEIQLPANKPAADVVRGLVERLKSLDAGVVSITGFSTAFPEGDSFEASLRILNFNREILAAPPLRQIWWMPARFAGEFIRLAPDLNSWFIVRLHLTEEVAPPSEGRSIFEQTGGRAVNIEDARKRSADLVARVERALEQGTPVEEIRRSLADPAVEALLEAGAEREAEELRRKLKRKLSEVRRKTHPPKVFISYSHDSPEHQAQVLALSDRLRADGVDCHIDQYEVSPPEGWPRWTLNQFDETDFVLVVCTETYNLRFRGKEAPGKGLGVKWEGAILTQELYDTEADNTRFIPVLFSSDDSEHIPVPIRGASRYDLSAEDGYKSLYRHLTDQPRVVKPELGKIRPLEAKKATQDFFRPQNLPYPHNRYFSGRREILKRLRDALTANGKAALTGLGGMGKTQTAAEYAHEQRDQYRALLWARAGSRTELNSDYLAIATLLNLPESNAQESSLAVAAVRRWLESNSDWLLILDNADEPELVEEYLPVNSEGHIILTSRARVFDRLGIARPIELMKLEPDEASDFFLKRTGRANLESAEAEAMKQLGEELDYLPLALEQAGAYIKKLDCSFRDYLSSYDKRKLELLEKSGPVMGAYPASVATTWSLNFERVEQTSTVAADLLRASTFFHADKIPFELITLGATELGAAISSALAGVDTDPLVFDELLEPLTAYSLIRRDLKSRTYSIHRMVQLVLKSRMDTDTQRLWAERAVRALNRAFPKPEYEHWPLCERLLAHAKAAAELIAEWNFTFEEASRLLNTAGVYCYERAQYTEAEPLYLCSLDIDEKVMGMDHPNVANTLNNLAVLYRVQGKYDEAEPLYLRSLEIREKALGPDHPDVGTSLNNLATLYRAQGKYEEAEPLLQRSLAITEKAMGPYHPNLGASLNNLALLYHYQGRYAEAEPLLLRSLDINEKERGPNHPNSGTILNNLALLYSAQGKYDKAEPLYLRSLEIWEKALGPDHPNVGTSSDNLAALYHNQGRYAESETLHLRSPKIRKKALGPNHPDVALSLNNLAALYRDQGKYDEAEPLYQRALEIIEKALGPEHPDFITGMENYAHLLKATGREAEAEKMMARAEALQAGRDQKDSKD